MSFIRDNAIAFAIGYLLLSVVCGVLAARVIAYGEREVPVVYDVERDVDPGDGYMGSWEHDSGHGAHWGRM